jgi:hypothetical protein
MWRGINLLILTFSIACTHIYTPVTVVKQRLRDDCGYAVVAIAARASYQSVADRAIGNGIILQNGLLDEEMSELARLMGVKLKFLKARTHFTESFRGIIRVKWVGGFMGDHYIYVQRGFVYDPLVYTVDDWATYLKGPYPFKIVRMWEHLP